MYGVVSLLDEEHSARIEKIWVELRRRFGVRYVGSEVNVPHISHHLAEEYDVPRLKEGLTRLCAEQTTIRIRTAGLGLFVGDGPALYVAVVRSPGLSAFHAQVWHVAKDAGHEANEYYRPERWMPHITLAQRDIDRENIGAVVTYLSQFHFAWALPVTRLALIEHNEGPAHIVAQYDLQKMT